IAEAFARVVDELKKQSPGRFQNVYVTPVVDGFRVHVAVSISVVEAKGALLTWSYDPTNPGAKRSSFADLIRQGRLAGLLSNADYLHLMAEHLEGGGSLPAPDAIYLAQFARRHGDNWVASLAIFWGQR